MFKCKLTSRKESVVVGLAGALTVDSAVKIKTKLLGALASGKSVVVELGDVTDVDLSFLQLLVASSRTAAKKKKRFKLNGPLPDVFIKAVEDSGFSSNDAYKSVYKPKYESLK